MIASDQFQAAEPTSSVIGHSRAIHSTRAEKVLLQYELYRYWLSNDSISSTISYLTNQVDLHEQMLLCHLYLALDSVNEAISIFEGIAEEAPDDWVSLNQLFFDLASQEKTWYELNETQEDDLREIANQSPATLASVQAQSVLYMIFGEIYEMEIDEGESRYANPYAIVNEAFMQTRENYLFNLRPNPAGSEVVFDYYLPGKTADAFVLFLDATARPLLMVYLAKNKTSGKINLNKFAAGVYFMKIFLDGTSEQTVKLIIAQ